MLLCCACMWQYDDEWNEGLAEHNEDEESELDLEEDQGMHRRAVKELVMRKLTHYHRSALAGLSTMLLQVHQQLRQQ